MAVAKAFEIEGPDEIVWVDQWPITRLQEWGYDPTYSSEHHSQIGSSVWIDTTIDPETTATSLTLNNWGSIDLFQQLLGGDSSTEGGGAHDPYDSSTPNSGIVRQDTTQQDFRDAKVEILVYKAEEGVLRRCLRLPNQAMVGFEKRFTADGIATETYNLEGDEDIEYVGNYAQVECFIGTYVSATTFKVHETKGASWSGWTVVCISQESTDCGTQVSDYSAVTITDNSPAGWSTVDTSGMDAAYEPTWVANDRIRLFVAKDSKDSWATIVSNEGMETAGPAAMRRGEIVPRLARDESGSPVTEFTWLRLQEVTISADLTRDELVQLSQYRVYHRALREPCTFTATVTALESDLEAWAKMSGKHAAWATYQGADGASGFEVAGDEFQDDIFIEVNMYNENDQTNLLKKVNLTDCSVTGKGHRLSVDGNSTVTWSFESSKYYEEGTGIEPS